LKQFFEEARRMIRTSSVSSSGNEELANYVATLLQDRGFKTQIQQVMHSIEGVSKRQFNVIGVLGDPLVDKKTRKGLLLTSHLDTSSPGLPENWTETGGDAFASTLRDGKIYGLGSADSKLDFLCKLHAVEKFREKKLKMPIYLVGTCGEEQGMFGAKYLIKSLALNPKYVVVGSPSDLKILLGHKAMAVFRVTVGYQLVERDARGFNRRIDLYSFGKAAHAASPELGNNAILQLSEFLHQATESGFEMRFTRVDGGDMANKVPDRAMAEFYLTSHQFEDFKRFFRETIKLQAKERAFRVELGGLGDMGVRFLPDAVFKSVTEVVGFFKTLSSEFGSAKDDSFSPPHPTVNLGLIKQKANSVELTFDLRLLPSVSIEETEKRISQGVQAIAGRYPSLNLSVSKDRYNPSFETASDGALAKLCRDSLEAIGMSATFERSSSSSEASQYSQSGHESVAFGPGGSRGNALGPNEHNSLEHLEKATAFYEKLVERVCL
jgi:succinyl-diaminopimelate desuccinylase